MIANVKLNAYKMTRGGAEKLRQYCLLTEPFFTKCLTLYAKKRKKDFLHALVAQSVECILGKDEVISSILIKGSIDFKGLRCLS